MERLTMFEPRAAAPDTEIFPAYLPVPTLGLVPINAFLVRAAELVLIDTGAVGLKREFVDALRGRIDLDALRWIWLTHTDFDHVGALRDLLDAAPRARLVTTFIGLGKLTVIAPIAPERVYLLNPGQKLSVGDRELVALRPPTFDAPETTALFDTRTRVLFSADCFGAPIERPYESAAEISPTDLRAGVALWATIDSPWLGYLEAGALAPALQSIAELAPEAVLSAHLPPAHGMNERLLDAIAAARSAPPYVGPDQAAMEKIMTAA